MLEKLVYWMAETGDMSDFRIIFISVLSVFVLLCLVSILIALLLFRVFLKPLQNSFVDPYGKYTVLVYRITEIAELRRSRSDSLHCLPTCS